MGYLLVTHLYRMMGSVRLLSPLSWTSTTDRCTKIRIGAQQLPVTVNAGGQHRRAMSKSSQVHTIRLPLRKICSALPAVVLISGAIMMPASAAPTAGSHDGAVSKNTPAVVVPDIAMTLPGSGQIEADPFPMPPPKGRAPTAQAPQPLVSMLPAGTVPGSSALVALDSTGIPVRALAAYRRSASLVESADPACHIDWALLAAIGRVESNHARYGGSQLDAAGVARPGIIGMRLDGTNGTALITDTDHGLLDGDTTYDRAVGPMQFIPSTWRVAGVDANGDGVKNPQDMADAAAATAVYLCSGHTDLSSPGDLRSAILRYNASDSYVSMVTAIADAYRHGVTALPASVLTPAESVTGASPTSIQTTKPTNPAPGKPGSTKATGSKPALTSAARALPQPAKTQPAVIEPVQPTATSTPSATSTAAPCVPTASPTSTGSPTTGQPCLPPCLPTASPTSTTSPTTGQPCLPPCLPTASPTSTTSPTSTGSPTTGQPCLPPCLPTPTVTSTASPTSSGTPTTAPPCSTAAPTP
jgi:hypothetical protein